MLLATSRLCRAWKALGAVLLGITAEGAGLVEEVSAAELSLQSEKRKTLVSYKLHRTTHEVALTMSCRWPNVTKNQAGLLEA